MTDHFYNHGHREHPTPRRPAKAQSGSAQDELANKANKSGALIPCALICTLLWGSAFPCMKVAYRLFSIPASAAGDQILFAGIRFLAAGLLTVGISILCEREQYRKASLSLSTAGGVLLVGLIQTGLQYIFYYMGMARVTGAKGAILNGTSAFFCVVLAHLYYRGKETLSVGKITGCLCGLAGVVVINLGKGELGGFTFFGEGFMLLAALMSALGALVSKEVSHGMGPITLCGWQFLAGGIILTATGKWMGGQLQWQGAGTGGILLLAYLSVLSAAAFSLWTMLLKYNPMARVTVFNFMIPVFGTILSAVVLQDHLWNPAIWVSLPLVCFGIYMVSRQETAAKGTVQK